MKFNYQARSKAGEAQTGTIEASSQEAALALLQKNRLFVTFLEKTGVSQPFYAKQIKLFQRVSKKDIVNFSRALSLMFKAKIPLVQSLRSIAEQTKSINFKEKIFALAQEVEAGTLFSQALTAFPNLFSAFYVSMVKSGEASGTLSESLTYLADHLEREYHLASKIQGAMIYPILILVVVIGVLLLMMFFVIPSMSEVLLESGQELPFVTRMVIALSDFLRSWGWLAGLALLALGIFVFRYFKTINGKKFKDKYILRIPMLGSFLKMTYISRFAENLSTLISGGLPIVSALEITGEIVGNDVYQTIVFEVRDEVKRGERISRVLTQHPGEFPWGRKPAPWTKA